VTTSEYDVFVSYSRNDLQEAANLRLQLTKHGLSVFKDNESLREGELWLDRLQDEVDACGAFVVLIGRDGVRRWIGAETQAALNRHFGPHHDARRLPIFPILLGETEPDTLPAFLRLFQAVPWNGEAPLPERLLDQIRERAIVADDATRFEGCPFVGLDAYRMDQAQLFFGRQKETLDALACFFDIRPGRPRVRWLEINGNSGSGKSSLMQAGLLPLIEKGWLWRPGSQYQDWKRIGPLIPGEHPVEMLAECLAHAFDTRMGDIVEELMLDKNALRFLLREKKPKDTAFLLALDQFEELFTLADRDERSRFDFLLAGALDDSDCPLFVISTVRTDFLDRFEDLPRLVTVRNRVGRPWTLAPIGADGLREVITGPARLAGLDVSEVQEAMIAEAHDEPGALPLAKNALRLLWEKRIGSRLSGPLFTEWGGLAGILSRGADSLLAGLDEDQKGRALELLFRLTKVDPEGRRHTRRRIPLAEAIDIAGGGERGQALIDRLTGQRLPDARASDGPLRLVTVSEEAGHDKYSQRTFWVNLIHETLVRSNGLDTEHKPQPYWQTLWDYIELHRERAAWRERLHADMRTWLEKDKAAGFQWSHERVRELHGVMQRPGPRFELNPIESDFLGPVDTETMMAELHKLETTHKRRLLIGERLDVLGEHPSRRGVGVDEHGAARLDWCSVSGGRVTISIADDPRSMPRAKVTHVVNSFRIARYPITVAQYRGFIEAKDGWCDPVWWGDDLYRDPDGETYGFGHFGNHPAVYVSWFDAVAFCRWISQRLGLTVRLPDEWEWQQAATDANQENVFPWGAHWEVREEPWRANTFESRLGQATAVGMYPAGASPSEALDMAGTVWEWCLNKFDRPDVNQSTADDFDFRVLRGGSWGYDQFFARSANRSRNYPNERDSGFGFRVACSSSFSENWSFDPLRPATPPPQPLA
jgi:formylglycine-generating enzyme required for sulfatase activity